MVFLFIHIEIANRVWKTLGGFAIMGKRAAEGVGPYRGNVRGSGEMKEMQ